MCGIAGEIRFDQAPADIDAVTIMTAALTIAAPTAGASTPTESRRRGEPDTGDGAGILIQVPDGFFRQVVDFELSEPVGNAVGTAFLPCDDTAEAAAIAAVEDIAVQEGIRVAGLAGVAGQPRRCRTDRPLCDAPLSATVPGQ